MNSCPHFHVNLNLDLYVCISHICSTCPVHIPQLSCLLSSLCCKLRQVFNKFHADFHLKKYWYILAIIIFIYISVSGLNFMFYVYLSFPFWTRTTKSQALPISPHNWTIIRKFSLQDTESKLVGGSRAERKLLAFDLIYKLKHPTCYRW